MPTPGSSVETTARYGVYQVISRRVETQADPKKGAKLTPAGLRRVNQRQILELSPEPVLFLETVAFKLQTLFAADGDRPDVYQPVEGDIKVLGDNGLGIHLQLLNGARTGEYVAMRNLRGVFTNQISFTVLNYVAESELESEPGEE